MSCKALLFLRRYNAIDHIVPIVHRWASTDTTPLTVVVPSADDLLQDYRLRLLAGFSHVRMCLLEELLPPAVPQDPPTSRLLRLLGRLWRRKPERPPPEPSSEEKAERLVADVFDGVGQGLVAFDWITDKATGASGQFKRAVLPAARGRAPRLQDDPPR